MMIVKFEKAKISQNLNRMSYSSKDDVLGKLCLSLFWRNKKIQAKNNSWAKEKEKKAGQKFL